MESGTKKICGHFGVCGGCEDLTREYSAELQYKQKYVNNLLARFGPEKSRDIIGSPELFYYRNKMEFAVSGAASDPLIGLRPREKFSEVIDVRDCLIFYPGAGGVLSAVREWIKEYAIEPYDLKRGTGVLRYVSMRHSKYYGHVMVILAAALTQEEFAGKKEAFAAAARGLSGLEGVVSVYCCLNTGLSDEALSENLILLEGRPRIRERINGIDYDIGPKSFFQTNPACCNLLYSVIRDSVGLGRGCSILDLFCGCGGISLQVCAGAQKVTGVDIVAQNISDARDNCSINGISNVEFACKDAQQFLMEEAGRSGLGDYSVAIVDPPRQGLTKKGRKIILESGIERVIYVSCNPWNLVQDLKILGEFYSLETVNPVDMFPHTQHIETVVSLRRNKF